ncbi:MAG: hypothetical protein EOP48_01575 [Sphingobacteriales bacterium]|nr:MAG: hypothetical protein EOP48_01575 [Sphingobacteriales bacterium]
MQTNIKIVDIDSVIKDCTGAKLLIMFRIKIDLSIQNFIVDVLPNGTANFVHPNNLQAADRISVTLKASEGYI